MSIKHKHILFDPPTLSRTISIKKLKAIRKSGMISNLTLRLPCSCQLNCKYCYSRNTIEPNDLNFHELKKAIDQGYRLGARVFTISGDGEPLLCNYFDEIVDYIYSYFLTDKCSQIILYSNCLSLTERKAKEYFLKNVTIVSKLNSLNISTQAELSNCTYQTAYLMFKKIEMLKEIGYNDKTLKLSRLAIHSIICKQNFKELPEIWKLCRENNIIPNIQILSPPRGRVSGNWNYLRVDREDIAKLFYELSEIDRINYHYKWSPIPPIAAHGCRICYTSLGITREGNIQICAYVETGNLLGNIRNISLEEVLKSDIVKKIRYLENNIHGFCKESCKYHKTVLCYGCRALTFDLTNDLFASDPFCWFNTDSTMK